VPKQAYDTELQIDDKRYRKSSHLNNSPIQDHLDFNHHYSNSQTKNKPDEYSVNSSGELKQQGLVLREGQGNAPALLTMSAYFIFRFARSRRNDADRSGLLNAASQYRHAGHRFNLFNTYSPVRNIGYIWVFEESTNEGWVVGDSL
jgi:hypothetical protein